MSVFHQLCITLLCQKIKYFTKETQHGLQSVIRPMPWWHLPCHPSSVHHSAILRFLLMPTPDHASFVPFSPSALHSGHSSLLDPQCCFFIFIFLRISHSCLFLFLLLHYVPACYQPLMCFVSIQTQNSQRCCIR